MLERARLTAFLATANPAPARSFYRDVLGLPLLREDAFALLFDANGIELRIQKLDQVSPQPFTALGWQVDDVQRAAAELSRRGVVFERYPSMPQDDLGIWVSPGGARVAWLKDPDGNLLSITQRALTA